ncbi:MAG: TonB-dependent receptor [Prolixibacteraceae bacterium]|nr:TonB-dependent receptor [Prolixibacteraceae bacterium]
MNKNKLRSAFVAAIIFISAGNVNSQDSLSDTIQIDEIIVTGSRVEVARKNVPLTVSTISRSEIEMSNETAVLPVLSHRIPGMFVTERGVTGFGVGTGSAGQINMRGIGGTAPNTQVLILIDGHPQYQGIFGHPLPDAYVSSDVEKVEVIRGPGSILYGSNAMAGVVNIITKKQTHEGLSGNARLSYGSYNTQKYMASGGYKKGPFSIYASVNHNRTDGHRDTSEFKIVNGYVKAGYDINKNFSLMGDMMIADFTSQDPGPVFNPSFFGIDILRGKASVSLKNRFVNTEGGLTAFYNFGNHDLSDGWVSEDYHAGVSIYQGFNLFTGNKLTVGADYKEVAGIGNKGMGADKWQKVSDIAGYTYIQQTLIEKFTLSAGLRLENNSLFGLEVVPQTGFSYFPTNNTTIKGSVSKGFRSPSLMELYLYAPNPDLEPEYLMNYEIGVNHKTSDRKLDGGITIFYIDAKNIIQVMPNKNPPPPDKRYNTGSFTNKGIELELNWIANNKLHFSSNYSYLDLDRPRLAAPKNQLYIDGTYIYKKLRANLSLQQISGLYTSLGNPSPLEENYSLVNAMISLKLTNNVELYVSGKNLLDQDYAINFGYPMPGITVFSGVNLTF